MSYVLDILLTVFFGREMSALGTEGASIECSQRAVQPFVRACVQIYVGTGSAFVSPVRIQTLLLRKLHLHCCVTLAHHCSSDVSGCLLLL
jgi:hypothetical protein